MLPLSSLLPLSFCYIHALSDFIMKDVCSLFYQCAHIVDLHHSYRIIMTTVLNILIVELNVWIVISSLLSRKTSSKSTYSQLTLKLLSASSDAAISTEKRRRRLAWNWIEQYCAALKVKRWRLREVNTPPECSCSVYVDVNLSETFAIKFQVCRAFSLLKVSLRGEWKKGWGKIIPSGWDGIFALLPCVYDMTVHTTTKTKCSIKSQLDIIAMFSLRI